MGPGKHKNQPKQHKYFDVNTLSGLDAYLYLRDDPHPREQLFLQSQFPFRYVVSYFSPDQIDNLY